MVLSSSIGALGSIVGGIGSAFASNAASKSAQARAYEYAKKLQQHQYNLTIKGYKEGPSAQRQGFTDAGYNPMLAVGNVGQGVNVAGGTPVSANATDTSGIKEALTTAVQLKNQTNQSDALSDEAYANADKAKAEKAAIIKRLPYVSEQAKADYMKTTMEAAKLENDIHYQNEYLNYLDKSLEVQQRLGEMGFSNAKDVANINASASRYGAKTSYWASVYNADSHRRSTIPGNASYLGDKAERALKRLFK